MNQLQEHNLSEIRSLNQRGGRTLSIMDLIADKTLTEDMAAYMLVKMAGGSSVLTAARQSGTGKSTLLANILGFLPPGERIISTSSADVIRRGQRNDEPSCYLAHEIGSGHWFGYIWGQQVQDYFALPDRGHRLASCLHADAMDELREQLRRPPNNIDLDAIRSIDLICFMRMTRLRGAVQRRVWSVHTLVNGGYELVWEYLQDEERFADLGAEETLNERERKLFDPACGLIGDLTSSSFHDFETMRKRVLEWYEQVG